MKYQAVIQIAQNLEISILAVISKIYSHISLSQKNKIKLTALNVATFLIKWGKKANPSLYKIVLETLGGVNVGNVMQRPEKLTVFAAKTWSH